MHAYTTIQSLGPERFYKEIHTFFEQERIKVCPYQNPATTKLSLAIILIKQLKG